MGRPRFASALAALSLAGCAALLPNGEAEVQSPWHSFDEAKAAIESIVPERTTIEELRAKGIDPYASPNVQLLSYSDVLLRFPMNAPLTGSPRDERLRDCLAAGKACFGYAIEVHELRRVRVGNFWLDTLGFRRESEVTGWTFNALILLKDDRVAYTLYGGQPKLREQTVARQPLGPAQGAGDSLSARKIVP